MSEVVLIVVSLPAKRKLSIFCDFDETITSTNVTDDVLARYADPLWREIQEDWLAGKLSPRGVLEKQMPLVRVAQHELDAFIDSIEVDPFFASFAFSCAQNDDSLYILSDGFDYWINRILQRTLGNDNGVLKHIGVFACHLHPCDNRLVFSFPYFPHGCAHGCATCKPALFDALRARSGKTIVIGDGVSDFLLAQGADLLIAKNGLKEFCQRDGTPSLAFSDFRDVSRIVTAFREGSLSLAL